MPDNIDAQLAKGIENLSDGQKTAIVICASSFRFGGNWGFIRANKPDFKGQLQTLKSAHPNVKAKRLYNGALVLSNENFLASIVNEVIPNAINGSFVQMANVRRTKEKALFQKFIENVAKGKSRYVQGQNGYYELVLGIFSINDTNFIRVGGKDYPAYKLTLVEALEYANQLTNRGFKVYAKAVDDNHQVVFDEVFNLATNSKGIDALYRGIEIADSHTGAFLTLRILSQ